MKQLLLEILACPMCKGPLDLKQPRMSGDEVLEGTLYCPACQVAYPVKDGIPNLIPPEKP